MNDRGFDGAWRVREYVYDAAGSLVGTVRQRRTLERIGERVRVVQECRPDRALDGHALARFAGRHVFELSVDRAERHYHGPAVVGHGWALGSGCTLGRGVWPALGYNFRSWAALVEPARQLTGGSFARADEVAARIVGVAVSADLDNDDWPTLDGPSWPGALARDWSGSGERAWPDGHSATVAASRRYRADGWDEELDGATATLTLSRDGDSWRVDGRAATNTLCGFGRSYGWSLTLEAVDDAGVLVEQLEVLDAVRSHLVVFRRRWIGAQLSDAAVLRLRPTHTIRPEEGP